MPRFPLVARRPAAMTAVGAALWLACAGCNSPGDTQAATARAQAAAASPSVNPAATDATAKPQVRNVILMIGDGMGPQQVGLLTLYARHAPHSVVPDRTAAIERVLTEGAVGVMRTDVHGAMVADSAASATQLATGRHIGSEMIGIDYEGNRVENIIEIAHRIGKSAGLVTDTRITHATPAGFVAHQPDRNMENEIAVDMLESKTEVLLGGGLRQFTPQAINDPKSTAYAAMMPMTGGMTPTTSKREDNRNLVLEAREHYQLVFDRNALAAVKRGPVLGLFADSEMVDAIQERNTLDDPERTQPTLVEMSTKAIELLDQNPKGFFLMVEGGQIDWDCHNNDAGSLLANLLQFDDAVRAVYEWVKGRDDTLLVVTGDHETGGFGFSYAGRPLPAPVDLPGDAFRGIKFAPTFNYAPPELLDKIYAQKKSYFEMFNEFDALPKAERTPERLVEIVNASFEFKITREDAENILARAPNKSYVENHPYLNTPTLPRIRDFDAFYVYGENLRMSLLGRAVADQQHTVWASGTHTSTPVLLGAYGPPEATRQFATMLHSTEVGQRMIALFSGNPPASADSSSAPTGQPLASPGQRPGSTRPP
jgi:alkaline phosphatase